MNFCCYIYIYNALLQAKKRTRKAGSVKAYARFQYEIRRDVRGYASCRASWVSVRVRAET
ncbi:hypothetical protein CUMW_070220 [Citrus unshiu]|nr:hypothetical protein CUMW_070220 [Citrus unshiu]